MIPIGSRVAFTVAFLKRIRADAYPELKAMRGTVVSDPKTYGGKLMVVKVRWDGDDRDKGADVTCLRTLTTAKGCQRGE